MRFYVKRIGVGLLVLTGALPAMGQIGAGTGGGGVVGAGPNCNCSPVQRQPYMAEFRITHVQTLADGTTITRETREISALDSQGRRLNANSISIPGNMQQQDFLQTRVHDPVENTEATWDTRNKTARVTKLPPEDQRHGCWANDAGNYRASYGPVRLPDQPGGAGVMASVLSSGTVVSSGTGAPGSTTVTTNLPATMPRVAPDPFKHEELGSDVIQGVEVRGTRITRTTPVGKIGNDRPIVSTDETWMAPSLGGIVLRSVNDSPQSGKQTREVVSLTIGDPDPSVFQPPDGYKVMVDVLHEVPCQQNQP
ncbi:MAG: hypothetical protein WBA18_11675 [Terracidiphilus sp.]